MNHLFALCVARHALLADHLARVFAEVGVDTAGAASVQAAVVRARVRRPDVVVCEYELLARLPLDVWEDDAVLRQTPVVAVSLTRRSGEAYPLDLNGIAGFLYLPTLQPNDAQRILHAAAARPSSLGSPAVRPTAADAHR